MLALVEVAVHPSHDPVEHVAGTMTTEVVVRDREAGALATEVQDGLQDHPGQHAHGPLPESTQALCEPTAVGRMVRLPHPPGDFREPLFEMLGPVADLEPGVQEAQQDHHLRKQRFPGRKFLYDVYAS